MSELTTWLLEQIAEDEAVARESGGGSWRVDCLADSDSPFLSNEDRAAHLAGSFHEDECAVVGSDGLRIYDEGGHTPADATHIARHDPARVLAECAAKRRIVEACREDYEYTLGRNDDTTEVAEEVLYALAQPYAGADGWREEWA